MIQLGERIKELRQRDGRTQETLANALGVTAQAVSRWEKGICYPDMGMIPSIANYFGVSIDELFGYDNERSKKIDALAERIRTMIAENNGVDVSMDDCITLAREALISYRRHPHSRCVAHVEENPRRWRKPRGNVAHGQAQRQSE